MALTAPTLKSILPELNLGDARLERLDADLIARAYKFSEKAHHGQKRSSGAPYLHHCVEVAKILAELHLDSSTVACGLIHDVVEDTAVTVADVAAEFGKEIAAIVDGEQDLPSTAF